METRKERSIIIPNSEMVRAILEGRKTQHRWPIKPQPKCEEVPTLCDDGVWRGRYRCLCGNPENPDISIEVDEFGPCPYGRPGDILWVKEAYKHYGNGITGSTWFACLKYKDGTYKDVFFGETPPPKPKVKDGISYWCSPIYMPKWASRIKLEVTGIRVEQIQDISGQDVLCEGVNSYVHPTADYFDRAQREVFARVWDSIWAKKGFGWDQNPWVWVIEFRRIENED